MTTYTYTDTNGLQFRHVSDDLGDFLIVETAFLEETLNFICSNGSVQLELNPQRGFTSTSIDFLRGVECFISGLNIVGGKIQLIGIERLTKLKHLIISDELVQPIEFAEFTSLTYCSIKWHKHYAKEFFPNSLRELHINGYTFQHGFNEQSLQNLSKITKLSLVQASVHDLSLVRYCGSLDFLNIAYCPNLNDIEDLIIHAPSLVRLDISNCKKIASFSPLNKLKNLVWLNLINCKSIPDISFVQHMPSLYHCVFYGTVVENGDLSYLLGKSQIAFDNKSHYSLKNKDFSPFA